MPQTPPPDAAASVTGRRRPRVLIVEDDDGMRRLLDTTLGRAAFEVEQAADGETALARAAARPPTVVLLDVNLPGLSGIEVCRHLKAAPATAGVPVVMVTAREDEEARRAAAAAGAAAYLVKPFSPRALLDVVYALLPGG